MPSSYDWIVESSCWKKNSVCSLKARFSPILLLRLCWSDITCSDRSHDSWCLTLEQSKQFFKRALPEELGISRANHSNSSTGKDQVPPPPTHCQQFIQIGKALVGLPPPHFAFLSLKLYLRKACNEASRKQNCLLYSKTGPSWYKLIQGTTTVSMAAEWSWDTSWDKWLSMCSDILELFQLTLPRTYFPYLPGTLDYHLYVFVDELSDARRHLIIAVQHCSFLEELAYLLKISPTSSKCSQAA